MPDDRRQGPAPRQALLARVIRRTHLYSGLLLVPFVLVYGVSAFLFNHGGSTATLLPVTADGTGLTAAAALAQRVAAELGSQEAIADERLAGSWTFEFTSAGRSQRLSLAADGSAASLRANAESPAPVRLPGDLFADQAEAAERAAHAVLAAAGIAPEQLRRTGAPTLRYQTGGSEVATPLDRPRATVRDVPGFDAGRLAMRLHTAHGYQGGAARVAWAVVVDLMAAAMVLWAASGLFMWWQKRSHRRAGLLVLVCTLLVATVLINGMHGALTR